MQYSGPHGGHEATSQPYDIVPVDERLAQQLEQRAKAFRLASIIGIFVLGLILIVLTIFGVIGRDARSTLGPVATLPFLAGLLLFGSYVLVPFLRWLLLAEPAKMLVNEVERQTGCDSQFAGNFFKVVKATPWSKHRFKPFLRDRTPVFDHWVPVTDGVVRRVSFAEDISYVAIGPETWTGGHALTQTW